MKAYLAIARPDHWFKNLFMLIGFLAALTYNHATPTLAHFKLLAIGLVCTCLAASFNYVINEILDAPYDALHPVKKDRPVPSGKVNKTLGYVWAVLLGTCAFLVAKAQLPIPFLLALGIFMLSGILYNVRPFRLKDRPFLDVIAESANNPIRLLLGWYCFWPQPDPMKDTYVSIYLNGWLLPPSSVVVSYWAVGGFMMTAKRFAELRSFSSREEAAAYRPCFRAYTEENLFIAMVVYIVSFAFGFGIMAQKYCERLTFYVPFLVVFIGWFFHLSFERDSIVKTPERLLEKRGFLAYCLFLMGLLVWLLFTGMA